MAKMATLMWTHTHNARMYVYVYIHSLYCNCRPRFPFLS